MTGYIIFLVAYSILHSAHTGLKITPLMYRPIFAEDSKIDIMKLSMGILAIIALCLAFIIMEWLDVILYTLGIRVGYFILLIILPNVFSSMRRPFIYGLQFFLGFYSTIISFLYFLVFEFIMR